MFISVTTVRAAPAAEHQCSAAACRVIVASYQKKAGLNEQAGAQKER